MVEHQRAPEEQFDKWRMDLAALGVVLENNMLVGNLLEELRDTINVYSESQKAVQAIFEFLIRLQNMEESQLVIVLDYIGQHVQTWPALVRSSVILKNSVIDEPYYDRVIKALGVEKYILGEGSSRVGDGYSESHY